MYDSEKWGVRTIIAAVVFLVMLIIAGIDSYTSYSEIDAVEYRAQVAADASKMADRIDETLANMQKRGVTRGNAALIFRNPVNDVALDYEALQDLSNRAKQIAQLHKNSVEYQTGLDDLRGTLREISIDAWYFTLIRNPLTWTSVVVLLVTIVFGWKWFEYA